MQPPAEQITEFVRRARTSLKGAVRADAVSRALYATDASNYQIMPLAVVTPYDHDDVQATIALAAELRLPVLPRGGGSSLAGQSVGEAVVLDFTTHMHGLLAVDAEARRARVQPGISLDVLNRRLAPYGLKLGPDPASAVVCTVGGMVGNNSTGSHSILYGMTADHVIAIDAILADGTPARFEAMPRRELGELVMRGGLLGAIYQRVPAIVESVRAELLAREHRTWRRCGGYNLDRLLDPEQLNLAQLLCGSEGTLATSTAIEVALVPLPRHTAIVLVAFDEQHAALEAVPAMLESDPAAIEHIDRFLMRMQREAGGEYSIAQFIGADDPEAVLITEFYGESPAELAAKMARLEQILARVAPTARRYRFDDAKAQQAVWGMRKAQAGLLARQRSALKPLSFIEDVAVPVQHLAAYIRDLLRITEAFGVEVTMSAHASAGCLHVMPFLDLKTALDVERMQGISAATAELVGRYDGVMSSEHGDGLARSWLNRRVFGEPIYRAFQQVKAAFDPQNRMNPGKIVDGPPMTEHLRFGPAYRTIKLHEQLDWSHDGGFAGAIEICNGQGYCRKVEGGTMCPTFMVTRNERDSTRGRANALRNALSGRIPREELFGPQMLDILNLCIGCKGCQSECPSAVDMTRIRSEYLFHYHQRHGADLRTRLFAHMPRLARAATAVPLVARAANVMTGLPPVRAAAAKLLGLAPERKLPRFAPERFSRRRRATNAEGDPVVLYVDTWAEHQRPEIAQAAHDVLSAAGYRVIVPPYACCGRTLLSKGFLPQAKAAARRVINTLAPFIAEGVPIVGLEPSCILTFRDEYQALVDDGRRAELGRLALTFEEFVAANGERFRQVLRQDGPREAILHGHCHQKAQVGTTPARLTLALAGYTVNDLDSGCCGMAGSFGYEAEHSAMSRAIAERVLLPAVAGSDPATTIVAAGVSCRQQIGDLAGRTALHPAEVLARHLITN